MTRTLFLASSALVLGTVAAHAATIHTVNGEGSSLASPTYTAEFKKKQPATGFSFTEYTTSSGRGFTALVLNTGSGAPGNPNTGSGVPSGKSVDWGASDAALTSDNITTYNTTKNAAFASGRTDLSAFGPIVQVPVLGTPIAVPVKNFKGTTDLSAGNKVQFTDADLCGAFSGKFTTWAQLSSTASRGNTAAFVIVYRSDSSGTTNLFTQHLKYVCAPVSGSSPFGGTNPSNFTVADLNAMPTNTFASLSTTAGLRGAVAATGSSGVLTSFETASVSVSGTVTKTIAHTALKNAIGYLSPDYTDIAANPVSSDPSLALLAKALPVGQVKNATNGTFYLPNVASTQTALLASNNTTVINANGAGGVGPRNNTEAKNQLLYVPGFPKPRAGYPIVGYTNWFLTTCYKNGKASALTSFLTQQYGGTRGVYYSTITANGFTPVTDPTLNAAVTNYIITNNGLPGDTGVANVNLGNATACAGTLGR